MKAEDLKLGQFIEGGYYIGTIKREDGLYALVFQPKEYEFKSILKEDLSKDNVASSKERRILR